MPTFVLALLLDPVPHDNATTWGATRGIAAK